MLKTKNAFFKGILILTLISIIIGTFLCAVDVATPGKGLLIVIARILGILSFLFSTYYILYGYSKDDAKYYKICGWFFLLAYLLSLIGEIVYGKNAAAIILSSIAFVCICILVIGKNLGKTISLLLCVVTFVLNIATVIVVYCAADSASVIITASAWSKLILAFVYGVCTVAKYIDKTERGAK